MHTASAKRQCNRAPQTAAAAPPPRPVSPARDSRTARAPPSPAPRAARRRAPRGSRRSHRTTSGYRPRIWRGPDHRPLIIYISLISSTVCRAHLDLESGSGADVRPASEVVAWRPRSAHAPPARPCALPPPAPPRARPSSARTPRRIRPPKVRTHCRFKHRGNASF